MDRNQVIGLILMTVLIIAYYQFFAPSPIPPDERAPISEEITTSDETESAERIPLDTLPVDSDSIKAERAGRLGPFHQMAEGEAEDHTIITNDLSLIFSNKGGKITTVELNDFKTYAGGPLILLDPASYQTGIHLSYQDKKINLRELYYTFRQQERGDSTIVTFSGNVENAGTIRHIYVIPKDGYQIGYQLDVTALGTLSGPVTMDWEDRIKNVEHDLVVTRRNTTINYYTQSGSFDGISESSTDFKEEYVDKPVEWIAIKQKFFTAAVINYQGFNTARISTDVDEQDTTVVKLARFTAETALKDGKGDFMFYFGPNKYDLLKAVAPDFSRNLYLGWPPISYVNRFIIIPVFHFLEQYMVNYGLIIVVLVVLIKLLLAPLSYKSYMSMAKMKVLKPELDEIKKKHGDDMAKAQQDQMKLYQQVGVSPLSGCIPILLQMPILFAMFYFFPNSIELRQESFLWANDLSTYDAVLTWDRHIPLLSSIYGNHVSMFTLLMTLSTLLYTWSNNQVSSVQGPMKSITYLMPLIFMFVLNSFPAGLSFYYFVSNLVTFGQQAIIKRFVDEDKLKAILEENKKRNASKKKSKFQLRLEEAMKAKENPKGKKK